MQFLPQSQANPEFITISWALNKLTPSLCQDSVRAEQFAFRASMDVFFSFGTLLLAEIKSGHNGLHLILILYIFSLNCT